MASKWLSKTLRASIESRDSMVCCYCGIQCCKYAERINNTDYATLDHIIPRYDIAQVTHNDQEYNAKIKDPTTLVVVCNGCNSSKKHASLFVWCEKTGKNYAFILAEIARRIAIPIA